MAPESAQDPNAQRLGRNLQRLRTARGLTQGEVAHRAGVARAHYAALEAGSSSNGGVANPRLSTLLSLASALESPMIELLSGLPAGEAAPDQAGP